MSPTATIVTWRRTFSARPAEAALALIARPATTWIAALVVLAIALTVRLVGLERYGFNSDEAVYAGQAAALAGHQDYANLFGIFRAHPLLVHFLVSIVYRVTGINDVVPRVVCVVMGVGLVATTGGIGYVMRGRVVGLIAMLFTALSAYPVIVSRQMLLDGPMALFFALTMLFMAMYVARPRLSMLLGAACSAGLAFLAKETAVLMVPAFVMFLLLARDVPVKFKHLVMAGAVYGVTIAPFPLALLLSGGSKTAQQFFIWQVLRRPNHDAGFYLTVLPQLGWILVLFAAIGAFLAIRRRKGMDTLLLAVTFAMIAFFQAWPVKGFQYLVPLIAPIALLGADGLVASANWIGNAMNTLRPQRFSTGILIPAVLTAVCACSLGLNTMIVIAQPAPLLLASDSGDDTTTTSPSVPSSGYSFTAGTGGLEASRPVGDWARLNTLPKSTFLCVGPSFANVIEFYGDRRALALSVSPNPLHRNPTYIPVTNPDELVRTNAIQYLVYDSYSAARTPFFTAKLMFYVKKYHGILVYSDYEPGTLPGGRTQQVPVVLIYEVHP